MIEQTSLWSYIQVLSNDLKLTDSYREILEVLANKRYGMTDQEIARECGYYDPNKIRPRRNELEKYGLVEKCGIRPCRITGKRAHFWNISTKGQTFISYGKRNKGKKEI